MTKDKFIPQREVYERLLPYAEKSLEKIKVQAGNYMGNKKCYHNVRNEMEKDSEFGDFKLAMVLSFIPRSGVNVHATLVSGDRYIDNTLGYLSQFNNFYLLQEYTLDELRELDKAAYPKHIFDLVKYWKDEMLGKVFTKKEIKDLGIKDNHI